MSLFKLNVSRFLLVTVLGTHFVACTTQPEMQSEEVVQANTVESQSLTEIAASPVEEPTAEENAALAEASSSDFNDPKDVQLKDTTVEEPASESPPSSQAAPNAAIASIEDSGPASPTQDEGSTSVSTPTEQESAIGPILFAKNRSKISRKYRSELRDLAKSMKQNRALSIVVSGHCDSRGSARYNKQLALKRAKAVKRYLTQRGVKASQIQVESHGKDQLLSMGDEEHNQAQNRRVEIHFVAH